jgi:hypothetical protein
MQRSSCTGWWRGPRQAAASQSRRLVAAQGEPINCLSLFLRDLLAVQRMQEMDRHCRELSTQVERGGVVGERTCCPCSWRLASLCSATRMRQGTGASSGPGQSPAARHAGPVMTASWTEHVQTVFTQKRKTTTECVARHWWQRRDVCATEACACLRARTLNSLPTTA